MRRPEERSLPKIQVREEDCSNQNTNYGKGLGAMVKKHNFVLFIHIKIRQELNAGVHLCFTRCIAPLSKAFKLFNTHFSHYSVHNLGNSHG